MVKNASLITVSEGDYLVQARNLHNIRKIEKDEIKFNDGEYPFSFPGACALFGGELEEGENAEQGFIREVLEEELPGLGHIIKTKKIQPIHRLYDWSKQVDEVLGRANEALHGNVYGFLGFDLESHVPQCALGKKNRGKNITYRELLAQITEDNFYVTDIDAKDLEGVAVREGADKVWVPHDIARTLIMVPSDKLALLDDYANRVDNGKIVLK